MIQLKFNQFLEFVSQCKIMKAIQLNAHKSKIYILMQKLKRVIGQHRAQFQLTPTEISIKVRKHNGDHLLSTTIDNSNLPSSFLNIFDNVSQLFQFVKDNGKVQLTSTAIVFIVTITKIRLISVQLNKIPLPKIDIVEEKVEKIGQRTSKLEQSFQSLSSNAYSKTFEDSSKKKIKALQAQTKRLNERIMKLQLMVKGKSGIKDSIEGSSQSKKDQKKTPANGDQQKQSNEVQISSFRFQSNSNEKALSLKPSNIIDFHFDVDMNSRFLEYYNIDKQTITRVKEDDQLYMLSSSNSFPLGDCHSLKLRINKITEGLMWMGVIVEKKKEEQYIGQESEVIQLSFEGNNAIIDGKKQKIKSTQFKDGDSIEMTVQSASNKIRFYKNGRMIPFYEITVPPSMRGVRLYPFIQMINPGDSISFF